MLNTEEFFGWLYELCEDSLIVWGPFKGPFQTTNCQRTKWAEALKNTEDIYFRLCPVGSTPEKGRGVARDSVYLPFLWLDVDCGGHRTKKYFANQTDAISWVKQYIPWSYIVSSGNGIHVYTGLSSPVEIHDQESFDKATEISWRFQQRAREMCPCDIDSTHDLARVLRVPGTVHSGSGAPVTVLEHQDTQLDPSEVEEWTVSKKFTSSTVVATDGPGFVLDPNVKVDTNFLLQIFQVNPQLYEAWTGKKEPHGEDRSPSAYRFSMISYLMHAGLERQDVVDLTIRYLIDQRGYSSSQIKLDRPGVWAAEISKCKVEDITHDDIEQLIESEDSDEQMKTVAALMEFPDPSALARVTRFAVRSGENNVKDMIIQLHIRDVRGNIVAVDMPEPLSRSTCIKNIFKRTGIAFPHYSGPKAAIPNENWRKAMSVVWGMAEELTPVESDTSAQLLRSIKDYINCSEQALSLDDARETGRVYKEDGLYVVPTASLNARATIEYPDLRSSREMHSAVIGLQSVGVTKKPQVYRGVRMACLLVPERLIDDK